MSGKRKIAFAIGAVAIVTAVAIGVAYWDATRSQRNARAIDISDIETAFKGTVADVMVMRQPSPEHGNAPDLIDQTGRIPEHLKANVKYFDTWHSALELANGVLKNGSPGNWVNDSADLRISNPKATDAWGHTYCVMRRDGFVLVISAGPSAETSPRCEDVQISTSELAKIPKGRLLETPAHSLILVASNTKQ